MKLKYLFCGLFLLGLSACNYLDIVPDEVVKEEDSYETPDLVRNYLYSCYSFLPTNRAISNNAYWMMCGAETSFYRKEMFSTFNEGTYGPSSLHMTSDTWSPIWEGIRQCYMFLDILDKAKIWFLQISNIIVAKLIFDSLLSFSILAFLRSYMYY